MPIFGNAAILGGRGMLGLDLAEACRADGAFGAVLSGDLPEADVTDEKSLRRFLGDLKPKVIFNCAGLTDVDGCEARRDLAYAVNAEGAGTAAAVAASLGATLVHISTNFVFDGGKAAPYVEDDPPAPLSVYGQSKLAGERLVAERAAKWLIVRTAWLYGRARDNFVDRMLRLALAKGEVSAVTDQVSSPTWTRDLAAALIVLAKSGEQGIFHVCNSGACSKYEQVALMLECARLSARVRPVDSRAFPRAAAVPAYSALSMDKLRRKTGHVMRTWSEALGQYVQRESPVTTARGSTPGARARPSG